MEITTLENIRIDYITEILNQSFSDYIVPFQLTSQQLEYKIFTENIRLDLSLGVFYSGKLVGFMLHALNHTGEKLVAYNAATGVIPDFRGQGLVGKMYNYLIPKLRDLDVDHMVLEVIVGNQRAIRAYEKMNYRVNRTLDCFKGCFESDKKSSFLSIKQVENFKWDDFISFWSIKPSWQNSITTLEKSKDKITILCAYLEDELAGYIIYNAQTKRIQQIAVPTIHRRKGIATQLINAMTQSTGSKELYALNIDNSSSESTGFFKSLSFENNVSQLEMIKNI
ncbi:MULTISPECIES: GNAT family N-acetyltransferase [unclassified Sphingobacterium]|uniref:GNAT family N-acetyltransferase n=1 Tax=unclassified Sphingobacterium TaxID=2609468 RepID=UPI001049CAA3|nr:MULTISPECIES: GNAT family N-acetyltransferase [unclassified Sphingobacterium]MCS3553676.1 ribosomal protein S18 acetylase RimI-like enzyme [Sphingobacterium sp. JUb21]TCR01484.1 ribosomal protein S18 acetylase RimI-like enzyme [Sphingobacterium sp. JUb20]